MTAHTPANNAGNPAHTHNPDPRRLAWIYLRRVLEASRPDVLDALWPGGGWQMNPAEPAHVEQLAHDIQQRSDRVRTLLAATEQRYLADPTEDADLARARGWRLITPEDDEWPPSLTSAFVAMTESGVGDDSVRGQPHAPFALWVAGTPRLDSLVEHSVTVVGTRAPSRLGEDACTMLSSGLATAGYTLISGAALGIDTITHRCALDHGASTIGILACGLDVAYPAKNTGLLREIVNSGGLLISEYAPGTRPARHRFLTRNRLAAALGQATLVVEAPHRSGALNTLNWAESMSRPTMAVPGPITTASFQGCLTRLAEQRATLVRTVEDVRSAIEPLGVQMQLGFGTLSADDTPRSTTHGTTPIGELFSWQHVAVYDAAGTRKDDTGRLAEIQEATGMDTRLIVRLARELERKGALRREGDRWVKVSGVTL